jgi:hypothetical protein
MVLFGVLGSKLTVERLSLTLTLLFFLVALFIAAFQIYLANRTDAVIAELKEISRGTREGVDKVRDAVNPDTLMRHMKQAIAEQDDPDNPDIEVLAARVAALTAQVNSNLASASTPLTSISGSFRDTARRKGWNVDREPTSPDFLFVVSMNGKTVIG